MNSPKAILKRPGSQSFEEMEFIKRSKSLATIGKVIFVLTIFYREKYIILFCETSVSFSRIFLDDILRLFQFHDFTIISRKLSDDFCNV